MLFKINLFYVRPSYFIFYFYRMAPAEQNVEMCGESMKNMKGRSETCEKSYVPYKNNNTVLQNSECKKLTSDVDFDLEKYEKMNFVPQIRWPDFIVQISLHLVSIFGLYLVISNQVRIYTTLFGKFKTVF